MKKLDSRIPDFNYYEVVITDPSDNKEYFHYVGSYLDKNDLKFIVRMYTKYKVSIESCGHKNLNDENCFYFDTFIKYLKRLKFYKTVTRIVVEEIEL